MSEASPFFQGVPQRDITIRGAGGKAPMFFRDVGMMLALFAARRDALRALLPGYGLQPLTVAPGWGAVAVSCFEYRHADIGPYHEVGISVGVKRGPSALSLVRTALTRELHGYVVDLPVDTEVALHGGLDYFNYPKFLADIRFSDEDGLRLCEVRDRERGELIYAFRGRRLMGGPVSGPLLGRGAQRGTTVLRTYPVKDGRLWQATLVLNELEAGVSVSRDAFRVQCGTHPRSGNLVRAGLGPLLAYVYVPRAEGILLEPTPLG